MNHLIDEREFFAATFGAAFVHQLHAHMAKHCERLNTDQLAAIAHEAVTVARGAIQGLRALGEGSRTL